MAMAPTVFSDMTTSRRCACNLTSLVSQRANQCQRRSTRKQTAIEVRWGELEVCFRPCAHYLDKSSVAQSWTEASRGDRISPALVHNSAKRQMQQGPSAIRGIVSIAAAFAASH